jgi:hypothetical protein
MKVFSSPQLGFNNNVRHKGRVFHIQTEDSGIKHPHVITHLFADGGRILKSTKTSYAEFVDDDELPKKVRALMQEQHKAMFIALRAGKFDSMLGDAPAEGAPKADDAPPPPRPSQQSLVSASEFVREPVATLPGAAPPAAPPSAGGPGPRAITAAASPVALNRDRTNAEEKPHVARPPADTNVDEVPPAAESQPLSPKARLTPPPARQTQPPPPPSSSPGAARRTQPPPASAFRNMMGRPGSPDPAARSLAAPKAPAFAPTQLAQPAATPANPAPQAAAAAAPTPSSPARPNKPAEARPQDAAHTKPGHRPPLAAGLDLDLQALELAAEQTNAPVYQQVRDLPPPPAAVFKGALPESTGYRAVTGPQKAPPPPVQPPRKPVVVEERKLTPSASRYAPSRPASIFGNAKPQEGSSIFGEDLISEKSLDEVILSYLAEDLESGPTKK